MRIDVAEFDGSDESAVRQAHGVIKASHDHEVPDIPVEPFDFFLDTVRRGHPAFRHVRALATLDGEPAGAVTMTMPVLDNVEQVSLDLNVHPALRRRGVGRALLDFVTERARAEGRKHITSESVQTQPDGSAFATAVGAKPALQDTRSRLDLTTADHARYAEMLAEARTHAAGYRIVQWQGVPADEHLDDIAYLDSRLIEDAPMGDLTIEPEKVDADRIRQGEQNRLDRGLDRFHTGAVHEASGRMVAWTTLSGPPALTTHLWQHITIVDPGHRGHRLGLIVKLENLRFALAHKPTLAAIDTFNASSNDYMLSINRALGFRAADTWMMWELTV